ncbi:MAG: hypothetical protein RL701_5942, partial [Pseudomonadota bacterium]
GLFVVDGSAVSANPGVNPSLTIAALAERAMSLVAARTHAQNTKGRIKLSVVADGARARAPQER